MTEPAPARQSWLRETLTLLRVCWRPLLAIMVVTDLVFLLASGALLLVRYGVADRALSGLDGPLLVAAVYAPSALLGAVFDAWTWAAVAHLFHGVGEGRRVGLGEALRQGLRRCGGLVLWLVGLGLLRTAGSVYLFSTMLDGFGTPQYRTADTVVTAGGWYLSFAVALLPLVVLLERRGAGRAWWLAHSRVATAGQIIAVLVIGFVVDNLADAATPPLLEAEAGRAWTLGLQVVTSSLLSVLTSALAMTALTVAYLRRAGRPVLMAVDSAPSAADPVPGGSEPVVIELGRTW